MENNKLPVLAIVGSTASGKTALGIALAREYGGEVISADSMQIYEGMDIATAKPTAEEMGEIPHHLIGILSRTHAFSVQEYCTLCHATIRSVAERGKLPILVGGTGLYVDSVLSGMRFTEDTENPELRAELLRLANCEGGREELHRRLCNLDPESAMGIHPNNVQRLVRALEICLSTGRPFSEVRRENAQESSPYVTWIIGIHYPDREYLYERINHRVDHMLEEGMLYEAAAAHSMEQSHTAVNAIGLKELFPYFEGKATFAECIALIKQSTRHYAKRQLTWFRRNEKIVWISRERGDSEQKILENAKKLLLNQGFCDIIKNR